MNRDNLGELYKKYELTKDDVFKHSFYLIITRSGIEKIQAVSKINIKYDVIKCEKDFVVIKANAEMNNKKIETFGSAIKGTNMKDGNTNSWYVTELAQKRAMSRAVLMLTDFYKYGAMAEDEAEDFKRSAK